MIAFPDQIANPTHHQIQCRPDGTKQPRWRIEEGLFKSCIPAIRATDGKIGPSQSRGLWQNDADDEFEPVGHP